MSCDPVSALLVANSVIVLSSISFLLASQIIFFWPFASCHFLARDWIEINPRTFTLTSFRPKETKLNNKHRETKKTFIIVLLSVNCEIDCHWLLVTRHNISLLGKL